MITKKFKVGGMSCAACQASVERAVSAVSGVDSVTVSLMTNSMTVEFDETAVSDELLCKAVADAGYSAGEWTKTQNTDAEDAKKYASMKKRLIASAVFAVLMMYVTMGHMIGLPLPDFLSPHHAPLGYAAVQILLAVPVIVINYAYFTDGFRAAVHGSANMNTLIAVGATASFLYGIYVFVRMILGQNAGTDIHPMTEELYFESVTMILTLISLGKTLEFRARRHTSDAVRKLMELTPPTAVVLRDGQTVTVRSDELVRGDIVILKAGTSVPCDGIVVRGGGASDESVITGESVPVPKEPGDTLICGTILLSGYAEMEAVHVGEDTTVAKITQLVEDAASSKAPVQKLADKISGVFVPVVCGISLLTFVLWLIFTGSLHTAIGFGISVLVISCPCALGLATPTAVMAGVGRGASLGILIKSADAMDTLYHTKVAVLDKTGTITEGKMTVSDVFQADPDLLTVAASLESMSEHPIGRAIVDYAAENGVPALSVENFTQTFGGGVRGTVRGDNCCGGNADFMKQCGAEVTEEILGQLNRFAETGKTPVLFAKNSRIAGIIALADRIKPTSRTAVEKLTKLGCDVVMLTGDCEATAKAIAAEAGIRHVISGVKPDEKAEHIRSLMSGDFYGDTTRRYAVMIGDGVNDAPALAAADCGMAVAHGTDIAIESASVVLVRSDLSDAAHAVELSRAVMRTIAQNLTWAFGYNVLCIPVAAGVLYPAFGIALTPMIAAAAMSLSSICVVSNALRLRAFRPAE
ncbi:MAG: copper-translocating P-type ATPase [Clostridia bacterium]|nr:copper-translocating P-type ATPase [Clostridia bacterium]